MLMMVPEMLEVVINTIMNFLSYEQLWKVECICCEIFHSLLTCRVPPEILLNNMLDYVEEMIAIDNLDESRNVVRVMHSVVSDDHFKVMKHSGVIRMLSLYHVSATKKGEKFHFLRIGFEIVLTKLLETVNVSEISKLFPTILKQIFGEEGLEESERKIFGLTLMHCVGRLRVNRIAENLQPEYIELLLELMTSSCEVESYLAARILATIIDRPNNFDHFSSLMIFREGTNYNIEVESELDFEAKKLFDVHRELFETSIICFIKTHSMKPDNLNIIYSLLCIIVASVPCGFIVTFVVCILMNLQEYLITESKNLMQVQINHLHSLIASVLTFICWFSRARSLTKYVHEVVNLRYDVAPYLNPPINQTYQHTELEHRFVNRNEKLFFDSWELRYSLWKRFRLNEELLLEIVKNQEKEEKGIFKLFRKKPSEKFYRINMRAANQQKNARKLT